MVGSDAPNPVTMVFHVLYETASGITGLVGLTPLQLVVGVFGVVGLYIAIVFVRSNFGDPGWSLDEGGEE